MSTPNSQRKRTFSERLQKRLSAYGGRMLAVADVLPDSKIGRHVRDQLIRSGSAPGAHYAEARSAQSRDDFTHKLGLAAKEARESLHWLRVARHTGLLDGNFGELEEKADELIAILFRSLQTARDD